MKTKNIFTILLITLLSLNAKSQSTEYKVSIGGKTEGNITLDEFLSDTIIHVLPGKAGYEVVSFKLSLSGEGRDYYTDFEGKGNKMDERMRTIISNMKPGTKVVIDFIRIKKTRSTDGKTYSVPPLKLMISEK